MTNKKLYMFLGLTVYLIGILIFMYLHNDTFYQSMFYSLVSFLPIPIIAYQTHKYLLLKNRKELFWKLPLAGLLSSLLSLFLYSILELLLSGSVFCPLNSVCGEAGYLLFVLLFIYTFVGLIIASCIVTLIFVKNQLSRTNKIQKNPISKTH